MIKLYILHVEREVAVFPMAQLMPATGTAQLQLLSLFFLLLLVCIRTTVRRVNIIYSDRIWCALIRIIDL